MRYQRKGRGSSQDGVTLLIMAAAMVVLLGICALAIDLVAAYLGRVQCQRAADAAALAGASIFVNYGCTSTGGCSAGGPQEALATTQAVAVAGQNQVMGLAPTGSTVVTQFSYPSPEEPQITVTVYRDAVHGDPLPTFFAKIFGIDSVNISASATAEAYNPSGGGVPVGSGCIKPFLVPNCDPNHPVPLSDPKANSNCPCGGTGTSNGDCPASTSAGPTTGDYMSYYVDPITGDIVNPGLCDWDSAYGVCKPGSGVIGAPWTLHDNGTPSQWYTIAFTTQSGQVYRNYITQCAPQTIACTTYLDTLNGKKLGPTDQGIDDLIHASADGLNHGQDYMCSPSWPDSTGTHCTTVPFTILGGSNNPYNMAGLTIPGGPSDSLANVVLYNGAPLPSGGGTVQVQGFMTIFVQDVTHSGVDDIVDTIVTQIGGCGGTAGSSGTTPIAGLGGSFIPIRLIRQN